MKLPVAPPSSPDDQLSRSQDALARLAEGHTVAQRLQLTTFSKMMLDILTLRDPYTGQHQRRVAELSSAICVELGLSAEETQGIAIAASLHDLGKIQTPAEILALPVRLSDVEVALLRRHPEAGYGLLKDAPFPWPVAEMVRQHHERIDGSGYPQGLKGTEILQGALIIAVADVAEAMVSHRPYRPAIGVSAALRELDINKGVLYDPAVVDACLRLFQEKNFAFSV